jgi:hypothetical protein
VRGLGFATVASPLPLVFSHFRGEEAFANEIAIRLTTKSGRVIDDKVDYRIFSSMEGPYNRRNAYGAVISFGAYFTGDAEKALRDSVLHYGFCNPGPLVRNYGIDEPLSSAEIIIRRRFSKEGDFPARSIPVVCT